MTLPPLGQIRWREQHQIEAELDAPKRLPAETSAELDARLPAVCVRALKGEM